MAKNTGKNQGKVREFCQSGKVGTLVLPSVTAHNYYHTLSISSTTMMIYDKIPRVYSDVKNSESKSEK